MTDELPGALMLGEHPAGRTVPTAVRDHRPRGEPTAGEPGRRLQRPAGVGPEPTGFFVASSFFPDDRTPDGRDRMTRYRAR
ncbi:hypothetical protein ABZ511_01685 [Nocardia gamkensis]|uniref:hypothetical protein n=1 Tax=Nocardia gamkensis TaxID=352869 RepID=UPI0033DF8A17